LITSEENWRVFWKSEWEIDLRWSWRFLAALKRAMKAVIAFTVAFRRFGLETLLFLFL